MPVAEVFGTLILHAEYGHSGFLCWRLGDG
jgi:hypothetical protein